MIKAIKKVFKNNKGFTLVELIVVLGVIAIIGAIAVPSFTGVQESAKEKADEATAMTIAKAAELYYVTEGKEPAANDDEDNIKTLETDGYLDSYPVPQSVEKGTFTLTMTKGKATIKIGEDQIYPKK